MTLCEQKTGGKILCIRLSALGDIVHCMSALTLLRKSRPAAQIFWIVEERNAGLLESHPYIDNIIPIPRIDWGEALKDPWQWAEVWPEIASFMLDLRKVKFDLSIDFQSSMKSSWIVAAAGAQERIGFAPPVSRELCHLVQNRLVTAPQNNCHRIERNLALLSPADIPARYSPPVLPCLPEHEKVAQNICSGMQRPLVVIHPGTSDFAQFKRWLPERYGKLALRLINLLNASVLVTFGPGEEALAHRVVAASKHEAVLAPRLSHIQQLSGIMKQADLFVGSDTGPMHIASALDTPLIALFGPKEPAGTGPFNRASEVVTADNIPCRPCEKRECSHPLCMEGISVDRVFESARRMLFSTGVNQENNSQTEDFQKPLFCDFRLGDLYGKLHSAYSCPDFYRFISTVGIGEDGKDKKLPSSPDLPNDQTGSFDPIKELKHAVFDKERCFYLCFKDYKGKRKRRYATKKRSATLQQYWKIALKMYERNLPCMMPVCWMRRTHSHGSREILMFNGTEVAKSDFEPAENENKVPFLTKMAEMLKEFHNKGFHHNELRFSSAGFLDGEGIIMRSLENVRHIKLPCILREICWGWELRSLYRDCKKRFSREDFCKYFIRPYCAHHIENKQLRRVFLRSIHPGLNERKVTDY